MPQDSHHPRVSNPSSPSVFPIGLFVSGGGGGDCGAGGGVVVVLMQDLIDLFAAAFICCVSGSRRAVK